MYIRNADSKTGTRCAIHGDLNLRLTREPISPNVLGSRNGTDRVGNLVGVFLQFFGIFAVELDGQLALNARHSFVDIVLDILAELGIDAWNFSQAPGHRVDEILSVGGGFPFRTGLEVDIEFADIKAIDIGSIVGAAELAEHVFGFREHRQPAAHVVNPARRFRRGNGFRHKDSNPKRAFVELGKKLRSDKAISDAPANQQYARHDENQRPGVHSSSQQRPIQSVQLTNNPGLILFWLLFHNQADQRGHHEHRKESPGNQRIG